MTCVSEKDASGEVFPFIKIPNIFSYWHPHTFEEVVVIVSASDLSVVHNLPKGDKMEMVFKFTHNMFKVAYVFSLVSAGRSDVLASDNPFKKRDTPKGKVEAMELKCTNLQK